MSLASGSIPPGFYAANELINGLPQPLIEELVGETVDVLFSKLAPVSAAKYHKLLLSLVPSSQVTVEAIGGACNAAAYIIRSGQLDKLKLADFAAMVERRSDLTEATRALFLNAWQTHSRNGVLVSSPSSAIAAASSREAALSTLRLGQLVAFDWKLGLGVASTHCRSLQAPFITVALTVASGGSGLRRTYAFEMSVPQFQDFSKTIQNIAQQLESV